MTETYEFIFKFVITEHYAESGWHEPWMTGKPEWRYELYIDGVFKDYTYSYRRLSRPEVWDKMCKNLSWHTHHRRGVIADDRPMPRPRRTQTVNLKEDLL